MRQPRRPGFRAVLQAACVALALSVSVAFATVFQDGEAECAACERTFVTRTVASTNTFGGIDADGCRTANGDTPYAALVQVCPRCLCARVPAHMTIPPQGERGRHFLAQAAKARPFADDAAPADIPNATKFELATGLLEADEAPPALIATVLIHAEWARRGEWRAALVHPEAHWPEDVPKAWRTVTDASAGPRRRDQPGERTATGREIAGARALIETADADAPLQRRLRGLHLAVILRCHGELPAALAALDQVAHAKPDGLSADEQATLVWSDELIGELRADIDESRALLRRCLAHLDAAGEHAQSMAIRSELHRRLGEDEQAAAAFAAELEKGEVPDWQLLLRSDVAHWTGVATPAWRDAVVSAWQARVGELVSGLTDAELSDDASYSLSLLRAPAARDGIERLLTGDDAVAASVAAYALSGYEQPGSEALAVLERAVADPDGDLDLRWTGVEALVGWGRASSAEAFRAVLAEKDDDYILEPALRGIGLTGGPGDVAAILSRADEEPEAATIALSLLTGVELEDVDAFEAWAAANEERDAWIEHALREAGAAGESLDDPDAVPGLIDLLDHASLPIRWNALRKLRAITGADLGVHEVRYPGNAPNPERPDVELDVERVRGDGWTVSTIGLFDMNALGAAVQPLRERNGRIRWNRAQARWRAHWEKNAPE